MKMMIVGKPNSLDSDMGRRMGMRIGKGSECIDRVRMLKDMTKFQHKPSGLGMNKMNEAMDAIFQEEKAEQDGHQKPVIEEKTIMIAKPADLENEAISGEDMMMKITNIINSLRQ